MSIRIDMLAKDMETYPRQQFGGKWFIAKPLEFWSLQKFIRRFWDAVSVLMGKSFAVHFRESESADE